MKRTAILFCLTILCFSSRHLYAQPEQLKFERYTTADGLPSNIIYSIFQDSKGFLWLGTHEGLCRYDGYTFKGFRNDPSDTTSISSNQVFSICEDAEGNIWAGTANGLCRYNYSRNNFTTVNKKSLGRSQTITRVICVNKNELMVLGPFTNEIDVRLVNIYNFAVTGVSHENRDFFDFHFMQSEDAAIKTSDGRIFIAGYLSTANHIQRLICEFDPVRRVFKDVKPLPPISRNDADYLNAFLFDKDNSFWIGTMQGHLFHATDSFLNDVSKNLIASKKPGPSYAMYKDKADNLWIATGKGLFIYNTLSRSLNNSAYTDLINSVGQTEVTSIFRDQTDNLWIGCFNGLFKLVPVASFGHITANAPGKSRLALNQVFGIRPAGVNKAWVGFLFEKDKFSLLDPEKGISETLYTIDHRDHNLSHLSKHSGKSIKLDSLDYWLERYKYAKDAKTFVASQTYESSLPSIINFCFKERYPSLRIGHIETFDWNHEEYWLATTSEGLIRINRKTSETTTFLANSHKNSINTNLLTSLLPDKNGNIWIGTNGGGLNYFDRKKNRFRYYTTREGLAHNAVYNMVEDDKGRLWIGTGNGLSCLDPSTNRFRNFYRSDGLVNSEYNRFSACKLDNGYLLMGGMDGIDYFHPDSVLKEVKKPIVQIADLKVFDKNIPVSDKLELAHNQNYITISFAAMDFRNPSANKFAYQLKGIDKDWIITSQNSVSYATLSPGEYHFLVKAANSSGNWSEAPAGIFFTIHPPWWKTWWFISIIVLFVFALLFSIYRFRIYQLKKVFAVRAKISRDLHDEVGSTLSGITMYTHLLNQQLKEKQLKTAEHSLHVIQNSASEMVDKLSDIVWVVNPQHDSLGMLLRKLEEYAYEIARTRNMAVNVTLHKDIAHLKLPMESRRNIYLVCKEAINNAVKYSEASSLELRAETTDHIVELIVKDNGKGFNPEQVKKGNGLNNMKQRMEEVGAEIMLESDAGNGTTWKIIYHL